MIRRPSGPRPDPAAAPGVSPAPLVDAATGQPLAGVQVWVEGTGRGTLTQNDGRYFLLHVGDGETVSFRKGGYAEVRIEGVKPGTGDVPRTWDVRLPWNGSAESGHAAPPAQAAAPVRVQPGRRPEAAEGAGGRITGRVVDAASGRPLAGVRVLLRGSGLGTIASESGRYFLLNVSPGPVTLVAELDGYATVVRESVQVREGETRTVNFSLPGQRR